MLSTRTGNAPHQLMVANDVDEYADALPGFQLDLVRTGIGSGPNVVRAAMADRFMVASSLTQFPVFGQTTVAEDHLVVGLITAAPEGMQWYGRGLSRGTTLVWGPEAEHAGVDLPGLRYVIVSISLRSLEETADRNKMNLVLPKRGKICAPAMTRTTARVRDLLAGFDDPREPWIPGDVDTGDITHAVASMLSTTHIRETFERRRFGNRRVTRACIDYVEATGRMPSISELCAVAHVSERKLREAFISTFGVPPSRYFRLRLLDGVRLQLTASTGGTTVDELALAAGFQHQGRFARYYFEAFGELPSKTLRGA